MIIGSQKLSTSLEFDEFLSMCTEARLTIVVTEQWSGPRAACGIFAAASSFEWFGSRGEANFYSQQSEAYPSRLH